MRADLQAGKRSRDGGLPRRDGAKTTSRSTPHPPPSDSATFWIVSASARAWDSPSGLGPPPAPRPPRQRTPRRSTPLLPLSDSAPVWIVSASALACGRPRSRAPYCNATTANIPLHPLSRASPFRRTIVECTTPSLSARLPPSSSRSILQAELLHSVTPSSSASTELLLASPSPSQRRGPHN